MSRKPQTCAECSRRKIKCQKVIPCDNCIKRGSASLCRRADVNHTVERHVPRLSHPLSPSGSESASLSIGKHVDPSLNDRMFGLVTSLSDRVKHLEEKLDKLGSGKRSLPPEEGAGNMSEHSSRPAKRPSKQQRLSEGEVSPDMPATQRTDENTGSNSDSDQPGFDAEVEDAATVLEFLAWGRLKDSNITTGLRDTSGVTDSVLIPDKDIIQTTQAWGLSPSSISGGQSMDTLQISQIQEMLPSKAQAVILVEYHADWLLFMHCAFHTPTLRRELEKFYLNDHGIISMTASGLQWAALLFAVICGSMACAKSSQVRDWGFPEDTQNSLAKQWYQASIECLNAAKYQQNHHLYGVQTIASSTICAHMLGFSNSQAVLLASAVRIAQSLGLHRLGKTKRGANTASNDPAEQVQKEIGRRVWQQLTTQDWFSVPFSETYCVNPLHFSTNTPLHCDEDTMQPVSSTTPTIMSYGNFLFKIASLMPPLLDRSSKARTIEAKYEEILRFDQMMRELVISELPACLNSQTPIEPHWPRWVLLARRCLTVTSAHKIIMIHRNFLGMSFHDKRYAFTRRNTHMPDNKELGCLKKMMELIYDLACLAAAKTIINEVKQDLPEESPILWTMQAFTVAAAIILSLDNFSRTQTAREHKEHRTLVSDAIEILSGSVGISSIATRGTRLLAELMAEDEKHTQNNDSGRNRSENQRSNRGEVTSKPGDKSLNVAAFVKKFCESDQPPSGNSPIAASHMPLWLQQDTAFHPYSDVPRGPDDMYNPSRGRNYPSSTSRMPPPTSLYEPLDPTIARRQHEIPQNPFTQTFSDSFDIRSVNWFDDLLGLAPSHSI